MNKYSFCYAANALADFVSISQLVNDEAAKQT